VRNLVARRMDAALLSTDASSSPASDPAHAPLRSRDRAHASLGRGRATAARSGAGR
jgi:hypothetical protein